MTIVKKPMVSPTSAAIEKFIEAAPDGLKEKNSSDGIQITLRMSQEQLDRITKMSKRQGIPRASYIKRCVFIQLESDEKA